MTCQDFENLLSAYLEADLPEERQREVRHHLSYCHTCHQAMENVLWAMRQCQIFPPLNPPTLLKRKIMQKTILRKSWWRFQEAPSSSWERRSISWTYPLAFIVLILMMSILFFHGGPLIKEGNKYIHQIYSSGVKVYYETERLSQELALLKEEFPEDIDAGLAMSLNWLRTQIKRIERKEEKKQKVKETGPHSLFHA